MKTVALVCAAGFGSLYKGFSKLTTEVGGVPMIVRVIRQNLRLFPRIYVAVNSLYRGNIQELLADALGNDYNRLVFIRFPWRTGTAGAVSVALNVIEVMDPDATELLVVYADMPLWSDETIAGLVQSHQAASQNHPVISMAVVRVPPGHPASRYGRITRNGQGEIADIAVDPPRESSLESLNVSNGEMWVNPSLFVFQISFLEETLPFLEPHFKDDGPPEFHLPPLVHKAHQKGYHVFAFPVADVNEALGVNDEEELERVRKVFLQREAAYREGRP